MHRKAIKNEKLVCISVYILMLCGVSIPQQPAFCVFCAAGRRKSHFTGELQSCTDKILLYNYRYDNRGSFTGLCFLLRKEKDCPCNKKL